MILLSLFIASFLSATIIPIASEIAFVACLKGEINPTSVILVATFGNFLGSLTTYFIGSLGKEKWLVRFGWTEVKKDKFKLVFNRYGIYLAFLAWLPFVGDVIVLFLGYFKTAKVKTFAFIFVGKLTRYGVLAWLVLY